LHNEARKLAQLQRRARVARLLAEAAAGGVPWGFQSRLASVLGVSRGTVSKDVAYLRHLARGDA
jgi:hypothetical protein